MILQVCSIYDTAAATFGRPFFMPSTGVAVRTFGDEVNRPATDNPMYQHPDDFILYHFGTFDDESGRFQFLDSYAQLARAKDMVIQK